MLEHAHAQAKIPARVVVIGSGGFVGGAIARRLADEGIAHLALGRAELDLLAPGAGAKLAGLLRPGDSVVTAAGIVPCKTTAMLVDNMRIVQTLVEGISAVPRRLRCTAPCILRARSRFAPSRAFRSPCCGPL
jgi:UDP-glucose 4-epimerase